MRRPASLTQYSGSIVGMRGHVRCAEYREMSHGIRRSVRLYGLGAAAIFRHWELPGYRRLDPWARFRVNLHAAGRYLTSAASLRLVLWTAAGLLAVLDMGLLCTVRDPLYDACYAVPLLAALPVLARHRRVLIRRSLARFHRATYE